MAIDGKSYRVAYYVLSMSAMAAIVGIIALAVVPAPVVRDRALAPQFLGQVLLLCFVVAEAARSLTQIVCYRRGA